MQRNTAKGFNRLRPIGLLSR